MVRFPFRGARVACIFVLLALPSFGFAAEPGFVKVSDPIQLRGCGTTIGYRDGQRCDLTSLLSLFLSVPIGALFTTY